MVATKYIKKDYEKPKIRIIELAADEVLAIGCKIQSSPTHLAKNGRPACGIVVNCRQAGS